MNSPLYSTEPFKGMQEASLLYCVMKEGTKCDLALLFPYPQVEWHGKKNPFLFLFCLAEAEWRPSRLLPSQLRSCGLPVSSGPEERGKRQKWDRRCYFAFLSSCMKNACLASWRWCSGTHVIHSSGAPKAVAFLRYLHISPLDALFQPRSFFHLETLQYDIVYTKGWDNTKHSQKCS